MFYYIVAVIILIAILMYFFLEFVHLPSKTFLKILKIIYSYFSHNPCSLFNEIFSSNNINNTCYFFNFI